MAKCPRCQSYEFVILEKILVKKMVHDYVCKNCNYTCTSKEFYAMFGKEVFTISDDIKEMMERVESMFKNEKENGNE